MTVHQKVDVLSRIRVRTSKMVLERFIENTSKLFICYEKNIRILTKYTHIDSIRQMDHLSFLNMVVRFCFHSMNLKTIMLKLEENK
ncbi:hypothetical protein BpHYR1_035468 [Brachionus plicatilis]|uniref:Uncharacterized protein n=1 Tax=Brachionus plicatilis TaxID=10195 RepID=A0A3M7RD43_BRAPC|nr:hypothetical protein BpHYR1_035468 [Brachionus plicatilis]